MRRIPGYLLFGLLVSGSCGAAQAVSGRLEWLTRVELRAVETGVVAEVLVAPGESVAKGQLLLRMDQRESTARLLEARARTVRTGLAVAAAQRELTRAEDLYDRGLIATEELKTAELGVAAANADQQAAAAAEVAAELFTERTELRAPFDGIVVARNAWNGQVVFDSLQREPLIVVAPTDRMLARALVTADVLRRYKPGQPVDLRLHGKPRRGVVYSLGVEAVRVELKGAVYELDVLFKRNPGELLRPSESVLLMLDSEPQRVGGGR